MRNQTVQSRINATTKKVKKLENPRNALVTGRDDQLRYKGFWGGVYSTCKIVEHELKNSINIPRLLGNKFIVQKRDKYIFDHQGSNKIKWDLFIGLIVVYSLATIPYYIGFQIITSPTIAALNGFIDCCFIVDILVVFNTQYVDMSNEQVVMDRNRIAVNYLEFWFWVDLASSIPFDTIFSFVILSFDSKLTSVRLIKILRLVRLSKLLKLGRVVRLGRLRTHIEKFNINPAISNVFKLVWQIIFVAHLISCFWHYITTSDVTGVTGPESLKIITWVNEFGYGEASNLSRYVAAFYWTIATILSVGYGDIHGTNPRERMFCVLTMLGGGVMFGAVIGQVTQLIESRNPQAKAFKEKMDEIKAYLGEKALPQRLKLEAKAAYAYYFQRKSTFGESNVFDDLPKAMLIKLINNIYEKEIRHIHLFRSSDAQFVVQLVTNCRPFQAVRGDLIYDIGDIALDIIFIMRGSVRLLAADGTVLGYCHEGSYFGDFEYLQKTSRLCKIQASTNCNLLAIDFRTFDESMDENADAGIKFIVDMKLRFEAFQQVRMKDTINLQKQKSRATFHISGLSTHMSVEMGQGGRKAFKIKSLIFVDGKALRPSIQDRDSQDNFYVQEVLYRMVIESRLGGLEIAEESLSQVSARYLFHPRAHGKMYWDTLIGALIVYSVLVIPVQIAFSDDTAGGSAAISNIVDSFFLVDIVFTCRTAYFSENDDAWVAIPKMIYSNYLESWFLIDLLSSVPFDVILGSTVAGLRSIRLLKIVRLTRLLKMARVIKLANYINKLEDNVGVSPAIFDLFTMLLVVILIGHFIACVWWGATIAMTHHSWIDNEAMVYSTNLRFATTRTQYISSLYWTITTLATVGYGDIVPTNTPGQLVNIGVMIIGATVFGYTIANVSQLMNSLNQSGMRVSQSITEISEFLSEKSVPRKLSDSIIRHFKHKFNRQSAFDDESILCKLPRNISCDIQMTIHLDTMNKIPLFKFISNHSMAIFIFRLMKPQYVDTAQYIVQQGDIANSIIFITSGRARVYRSTTQRPRLAKVSSKVKFMQAIDRNASLVSKQNTFEPSNTKTIPVVKKTKTWVDPQGKFWDSEFQKFDSWVPASSEQLQVRDSITRLTNDHAELQRNEDKHTSLPKLARNQGHAPAALRKSLNWNPSMKRMSLNVKKVIDEGDEDEEETFEEALHEAEEAEAAEDSGSEDEGEEFVKQTRSDLATKGKIYLGEVGKGDFVGHVGLMQHRRHGASVRALEACSLYVFKKTDIFRLLREHPAAGLVLQMALGKAIAAMDHINGRAHMRSARAHFLSDIKSDFLQRRAALVLAKVTKEKAVAEQSSHTPHFLSRMGVSFVERKKPQAGGSKRGLFGKMSSRLLGVATESCTPPPEPESLQVKRHRGWALIRSAIHNAKIQATVTSLGGAGEDKLMTCEDYNESATSSVKVVMKEPLQVRVVHEDSGRDDEIATFLFGDTALTPTSHRNNNSNNNNNNNNNNNMMDNSLSDMCTSASPPRSLSPVNTASNTPPRTKGKASSYAATAAGDGDAGESSAENNLSSSAWKPRVATKTPVSKVQKKKANTSKNMFAKAIRVKTSTSIEEILNENTMNYDTDDELNYNDVEEEEMKAEKLHRKHILMGSTAAAAGARRSSIISSSCVTSTTNFSKWRKAALVRQHRSESDLLELHRAHVKQMQLAQQAEKISTVKSTTTEVTTATASNGMSKPVVTARGSFTLPASGMYSTALSSVMGGADLPPVHSIRARRMSYPTLDMSLWHTHIKESGLV